MKKEIRLQLSAKRLAISAKDWEERSRIICERIVALPGWKDWSRIALYLSFRNEVDLSHLPRLAPEKDYFYPRTDSATAHMSFHKANDHRDFRKGNWGLIEPDGAGETLIPDLQTLIVVPALAFDRQGHRLGYGKGFYDRYLERLGSATLGVCFSEFLLDRLPIEAHDVPVQFLITELEVLSLQGVANPIYKP